jgi:hypothetical protein
MKFTSSHRNKSEKGNVLALFGLAIAGLTVIVGMVVAPIHNAYITQETLQQGVDAAARAASGQFVRNYTIAAMQQAAQSELDLYNIQPQSWAVETCDAVAADNGLLPAVDHLAELITIEHDSHPGKEVCTDPLRKLVRVRVTAPVEPDGLPATVEVVAEAASMDLVLVIDTSESMSTFWNGLATGDNRDPSVCNINGNLYNMPGSCLPFQDVKQAASLFIENLYFPYDRVSVVTFAKDAAMILPMSGNHTDVTNAIKNLKVFEGNQRCPYTTDQRTGPPSTYPPISGDAVNPCRLYNAPNDPSAPNAFRYFDCPSFYGTNPDASACTSTNIADGVGLAGSILTGDYSSSPLPPASWPVKRDSALRVMLLLTDGAANSGHDSHGGRICPPAENSYAWMDSHPLCRDADTLTRHCRQASDTNCLNATYPTGNRSVIEPLNYDGDDSARDMFDLVSSNSMLIFTIGMGAETEQISTRYDINGISPAETLLKYGAFGTYYDMTHPNARKGQYYYGSYASGLSNAFLEVANQLNANLVPTATPTSTPTPGETETPTITMTPTITSTPTETSTQTMTPTETGAPTETITPTLTGSATFTPAMTRTPTKTITPARTLTRTPTKTATPATLTFVSVAAQDGWVLESSENSGMGGSVNSTATSFRVGDDAANRQYRAILSFNTAALPDNAVIRSAVLKIKYLSTVGANPFGSLGNLWAQIRQGPFNNNSALETADFSASASTTSIVGVFNGPFSNWYNAPLTATGRASINRSGLTQFRLRFAMDDNNNHSADYMNFFSGNYTSGQPQLVITYTLP